MVTEPLTLVLVASLCCLVIADGVLTYEILRRGGKELNPVMRWIFEKLGVIEGIVVSRLVMLATFGFAAQVIPAWAFLVLFAFYAFVITHNVNQLKKDK